MAQNTEKKRSRIKLGSTLLLLSVAAGAGALGSIGIARSGVSFANEVKDEAAAKPAKSPITWIAAAPGRIEPKSGQVRVGAQWFSLSSDKLSFSTNTEALRNFAIFNPDKLKVPAFEGKVPNQNLHSLTAPELIIIAHSNFLSEAQRLSSHRQNHSGISALVVTTDQVFNEFGGGKHDVPAIRDFVRTLYDQAGSQLKNILLFGRGSYDYKNRVLGNTNYVPIYESRNSLSPLETYGSDDYYTFLEAGDGEWSESPVQNHTMDVGVGRLPVKTTQTRGGAGLAGVPMGGLEPPT